MIVPSFRAGAPEDLISLVASDLMLLMAPATDPRRPKATPEQFCTDRAAQWSDLQIYECRTKASVGTRTPHRCCPAHRDAGERPRRTSQPPACMFRRCMLPCSKVSLDSSLQLATRHQSITAMAVGLHLCRIEGTSGYATPAVRSCPQTITTRCRVSACWARQAQQDGARASDP